MARSGDTAVGVRLGHRTRIVHGFRVAKAPWVPLIGPRAVKSDASILDSKSTRGERARSEMMCSWRAKQATREYSGLATPVAKPFCRCHPEPVSRQPGTGHRDLPRRMQ